MLRQRILTAAVLLPLALAALFFLPSLAWSVLTAAVMVIGGWEWGRLAGWNSRGRALFAALVGGSCIAVLAVLESSLPRRDEGAYRNRGSCSAA